jgi:hypothetical protein
MKMVGQVTLVIATLAGLAPSWAQTFPTIPSQTVIGRTQTGPGPAQAIPFSQLAASFCNTFTLTLKGCVPPPGATTGRYLSDDIATPWKALSTQQIVQGAGVTATGTCSGTSLNCTINATAATQYVVPSRAAAAASDLSALSSIQTLGYATPGDGGGATFKNIGAAPFSDSHVTSGTISAAGAGYTNGTYYQVLFTGGSGNGFSANIVVAGGVVTTVTIVNEGGQGYTVGDVLTAGVMGAGAGFTWTVSTVSTPLASFTDSAGTHWQYVVDAGNYINVRQFGAKADFSTNDQPSIQAAINFAHRQNYTSPSNGCPGGGGSCGSTVLLPAGTMVINNTIKVYNAVELRGMGQFNSGLLLGASFPVANDGIHLCDMNIQLACFGARVTDLSITSPASLGANNLTYLFNSNAVQQTEAIARVAAYALNPRGCFKYTNGYGGAAKFEVNDFQCTVATANLSDGIVLNPTTTVNMVFNGLIVEAGGAGYSGNAVNWQSGNLFINGLHTEGIDTGVFAQNATSTHMGSLHGATGGNLCTQLVKLSATNTLGNFVIGTSQVNGCTRLITNFQPGGADFAGPAIKDITCNPGAPCN